jgi:sarcosine oxidase
MPLRDRRHTTADVIVVGLGAMGSAAAYHLARRGARVLGIDRFSPGHANGSSHGDSRIIRELYYEHPCYVPLVRHAYGLWADLAAESETSLLHVTGALMLGAPDSTLLTGCRRSGLEHGVPFDTLSADEIRRRFPAMDPPDSFIGLWDTRAGYLEPETAVRAHLSLAERHGATLRFDERVTGWEADGDGVAVTTSTGRYLADRLVLAAGAWTTQLVPDLALPLVVERQVLVWLDPPTPAGSPDPFGPARFPIYLCEYAPDRAVYGFPRLASGAKAGVHHEGERGTDADAVRRTIDDADVARVRDALRAAVSPRLADSPIRARATCVYTDTPDAHFIIDAHPAHANVLIVSACSGHGFKFASAIGQASADLVTDRPTAVSLDPFTIARFLAPIPATDPMHG